MLNAGALGLSYGDYVARPVDGSRRPRTLAEHRADRAALLASNDRLATLSADLVALVTPLRQAKMQRQGLAGIASKRPTPRSAATSVGFER